jgi:DNA-binding winged helix-turn-helix (wHTH) protein
LILDTRRQRVWRDGREIPLPKLSYDLFVVLVRRSPEVASNEELMKAVWPGLVVSPETVSQRVKLLRDALGDDPRTPRYVGSLRARGYHLVPPAEALANDGEPPGVESPAAPVELFLIESEGGEARRARPDWAVTEIPTPEMRAAKLKRAPPETGRIPWRYLSWPLIGAVGLGLAYLAYRHGM